VRLFSTRQFKTGALAGLSLAFLALLMWPLLARLLG
jgi:hypothetical protein